VDSTDKDGRTTDISHALRRNKSFHTQAQGGSLRLGHEPLALHPPRWNNPVMIIGDRLREMREEKKLSQGDVEKRTGLLRCYISRVENGHTVPAIETLEKLARAFEVPLYQLFYEGEEPPKLPNLLKRKSSDEIAWGSSGKDGRFLNKLRRLLGKANEGDRKLVLYMAQKMARR
jgi:transcriptional regulator with XRE-family HTH domain